MSRPAWIDQDFEFPYKVSKLELSERDGDVFDLAFLRPPSYFSSDLEFEHKDAVRAVGKELEHENLPGVYLMDHVLSEIECKRIIVAAESIGFYESKGIGDATKTGKPCPPKAVLVIRPDQADIIYQRIRNFLPEFFSCCFVDVKKKYKVVGVNPRLRIHKYEESFMLGPHYDRGHYRGSAMDESGELRFDYYGDDRHSQMSLLIYLNGIEDCALGGETSFFPDPDKSWKLLESPYQQKVENISWAKNVEKIRVNPVQGAAVAFFHGDHPLSPLHEGSEVLQGFKYIIRTDVLCTIESEENIL